MIWIVRIFYIALFWSIDTLVYLRLGKQNVKAQKWLIIALATWTVFLIFHLPVFNFSCLISLNAYLQLFGYVIALLFSHYFGRFAARLVTRSAMNEDIKESARNIIWIMFDSIIFGFIAFVHLFAILVVPRQ